MDEMESNVCTWPKRSYYKALAKEAIKEATPAKEVKIEYDAGHIEWLEGFKALLNETPYQLKEEWRDETLYLSLEKVY